MDTKDIQQIFKCSKNTAYKLMHSDGFPSIKIGHKYLVNELSLERWIKQNEGKEFQIR